MPGETETDIRAIGELLQHIQQRFSRRYRFRLSAGIGIFTPRPGTPFYQEPFCGLDAARRKISQLRKYVSEHKVDVALTFASPYEAGLETLLGTFGEEAAAFLARYLDSPDKWRRELKLMQDTLTKKVPKPDGTTR